MRKLLLVLLFVPVISFGQNRSGLELCVFLQQASPQFASTSIANNALNKILEVNNLRGEFVLVPCDQISNVVAMTYNGTRYILYDKEFMASLDDNSNITNLSILAHEIGHHVNGHVKDIIAVMNGKSSPKSLVESRQQELEADEFAGFTLSKLGVSINQVNKVFEGLSDDNTDIYSTHPSLSKRLAAVKRGYDNNNKIFNNRVVSQGQELIKSPTLYYLKISDLYRQEKYEEAENLADEAITKYPYNSDLYFWRAKSLYGNLSNYTSPMYALELIIELYSKAIEIDPNYFAYYYWRGAAKYFAGSYDESIKDMQKSIKLKDKYKSDDVFKNEVQNISGFIGMSHFRQENYAEAIKFLNEALESGFTSFDNAMFSGISSKVFINQHIGFSYFKLGNFSLAKQFAEKDIELNQNNSLSYWIKALVIGRQKGYKDFLSAYKTYLSKVSESDYPYQALQFSRLRASRYHNVTSGNSHLKEIEAIIKETVDSDDWQKNEVFEIEKDLVRAIEINGKGMDFSQTELYPAYELLSLIFNGLDNKKELDYAIKALQVAGKAEESSFSFGTKTMRRPPEDLQYLLDEAKYNKAKANDRLGTIYIGLKDWNKAKKSYAEFVKLYPNEVYGFNQLAVCKRESGDPEGAIIDYNKALDINPNYTSSIGGRGTAKQYLNNLFGACDDWTRAVELGGESYQSKIDEFCNLNSSINAGKSLKEKATEELKKLKELLDLGLLTQEEFDKKAVDLKKIILGN
jgi:tetratricopeptide (TPR) repeat protein